MAGHDNEGGQNVMGKTCHKHVMLVFYGTNDKIRSMGNKIIVVSRGETKKLARLLLHCRDLREEEESLAALIFGLEDG